MAEWSLFYGSEFALILIYSKLRAKPILIAMFGLMGAFSGLRFEVGNDYWHYLNICSGDESYAPVEYGYTLISNLLNSLEITCDYIFLIFSLATTLFLYLGAKKFKNPQVVLLFYLIIPGLFVNSLNTIRQHLAMAILFYACVDFAKQKNILKYCVMGFLASSIHLVALPAFLVTWITNNLNLKINYKTALGLLILGLALSLTGIDNLILSGLDGGRYEIYFQWLYVPNLPKVLTFNLIAVYVIIIYKKSGTTNTRQDKLFNAWLAGAFLYNLFSNFEVLTRGVYYLTIFLIAIIAIIIESVPRNRSTQAGALLGIIYSVGLVNTFIIDQERRNSPDEVTPGISNYRTVFNKP